LALLASAYIGFAQYRLNRRIAGREEQSRSSAQPLVRASLHPVHDESSSTTYDACILEVENQGQASAYGVEASSFVFRGAIGTSRPLPPGLRLERLAVLSVGQVGELGRWNCDQDPTYQPPFELVLAWHDGRGERRSPYQITRFERD
jgi:hypothetical protein